MSLYKILFLGDIVGISGCRSVKFWLAKLKTQLEIDLVVANVENSAPSGIGITPTIYKNLLSYGIDAMTSGNNIFNYKEINQILEKRSFLVRPLNYGKNIPGKGILVIETAFKKKFIIINFLTRLFMPDKIEHPLDTIKYILETYSLNHPEILGILVDIHGESNYEKMALAHILDGHVSCVLGTHTHVPSADSRILEKGTAYQTDVGMCGDYNSVVGINKNKGIEFYKGNINRKECFPGNNEATLCGSYIGIGNAGLAEFIYPIRLGGVLEETNIENIRINLKHI